MLKADLHIHSTVSDGSETMADIVRRAEQKGIGAVAFTEHDTLSHLPYLPRSGKVRVLGGVEISAMDPASRRKAHILGYNLQKPELVTAWVRPLLEARNRNSKKQVRVLQENGLSIDPFALRRAEGKYLYKQHIMDYLVATGQAEELFGDFYRRVFKNQGICDFDIEYLDAYEAVEVILRSGGRAVLAHGGQQQNFDMIPRLVERGLTGLELNHPANSEADKRILREYATRYGLFLTGGSDYHGRFQAGGHDVGAFLAEESGVQAVCGGMCTEGRDRE